MMTKQTLARGIALVLAVLLALGCFLTPALAAEAPTAETADDGERMPILPILFSAIFGGGAAVVMMNSSRKK